MFAEGTASLKTLDQEYVRTFKEQRQVCQKGTWVEQNGGGGKVVAGQVCLFGHLQSDFILCGGKAMGGLWSDFHHQVIYGKFLQVSNLTNCSLMRPTSDKHWLENGRARSSVLFTCTAAPVLRWERVCLSIAISSLWWQITCLDLHRTNATYAGPTHRRMIHLNKSVYLALILFCICISLAWLCEDNEPKLVSARLVDHFWRNREKFQSTR